MKKKIYKEEIISKIKNIITTNKGVINPNEAISITGYSKDDVITALNRLIELYDAKVVLDDIAGGLKYMFKYPLYKRNKRTFKEVCANFGRGALKVFKIVYKSAVGVILIAYTIIFILILSIALRGGNNNNNNNNNSSALGFHLLIRIISEIFFWNNMSRHYNMTSDRYGNKYRTYQGKEKEKGEGFIKGVFSFVFGPDIPPIEEEADVREVASYIRLKTKGIITAANMIELAGIPYHKADSRLAEYCGKFDGYLDINNDGVVYANCSNLLGSTSQSEYNNITYYIDEVEPPIEFTGNKSGRNFAIICMNAFNLIMSSIILHLHYTPSEYYESSLQNIINVYGYWLGWFPLIVSISYFLIPLIRFPSYYIKKKNRNKRVLHKILIGSICRLRKRNYSLNELVNIARSRMEVIEDDVKNMMNEIVSELNGSIDFTNDGVIIYTFDRLYNEFNI
ncbi:MAG: hypothetical protein FWG85_03700 [Bacteroidetes bacterium]|nr:hypothetical protein [Bacteroidota bacterium]